MILEQPLDSRSENNMYVIKAVVAGLVAAVLKAHSSQIANVSIYNIHVLNWVVACSSLNQSHFLSNNVFDE